MIQDFLVKGNIIKIETDSYKILDRVEENLILSTIDLFTLDLIGHSFQVKISDFNEQEILETHDPVRILNSKLQQVWPVPPITSIF